MASVNFNDSPTRGTTTVTDQSTPQPQPCLHRRRALQGMFGVGIGVPLLAACGGDTESAGGGASPSSGGSSSPATGGSASASQAPAAGGGGLTTTAEIPVGGGTVFAEEKVVVTQPSEGEFLAFSAICTHQGCPVSGVEDGAIVCKCHNSQFSIEDGSPQGGPASAPLEEVPLTVAGDQISLA